MSSLIDRLVAYGGAQLLEQSTCLIAQIGRGGQLLEWNASAQQLIDLVPSATTVPDLLDTSSRPRFWALIDQALASGLSEPMLLNFSTGPHDLPHSYNGRLLAIPDQQLILFAEPIAPLDAQAAQEYMRVTNDLAMSTRDLQKARHELIKKQMLLEGALERLERLAQTDELTQIFNRRCILNYLKEEIDRATRYSTPLSVMLIDIDFFKQINDRYGHQVGDAVLCSVAGKLQHSIRASDHLGRYGGEEFLCVLPMTEASAAAELADRLCRQIGDMRQIAAETIEFCVTISVGVAGFDWQTDSLGTLIAHADEALYQSKACGRDQYQIWH